MRLATVGIMLAWMVRAAYAGAATCTITAVNALIPGVCPPTPLPPVAGYAIPVEVAEDSGALTMDFSGAPAGPFQCFVSNELRLALAGVVSGTIDAAGNVALAPAPIGFATDLKPGEQLNAVEIISTGISTVRVSSQEWSTVGTPLNFSTGVLHLVGQGVVHNAPVVGEAPSGIDITCTLAPLPSKDSLPKAFALSKVHGVGKPGDASTGDALTLQAKFTNGAAPFDFATNDVLVRLTTAAGELLLLRVPAGSLSTSGKKLSANDSDGSVFHVFTGAKPAGNGTVPLSGSLTVKTSKKGFTLTLKETGVDLSPLAGPPAVATATVTVGVGPITSSRGVQVKIGKKHTTFK